MMSDQNGNQTVAEINYFSDWINTLSVATYPDIKKEVIEKCKISDQIFRHWKSGNTKVPELAQEKINQIAGYEIFKLTKP